VSGQHGGRGRDVRVAVVRSAADRRVYVGEFRHLHAFVERRRVGSRRQDVGRFDGEPPDEIVREPIDDPQRVDVDFADHDARVAERPRDDLPARQLDASDDAPTHAAAGALEKVPVDDEFAQLDRSPRVEGHSHDRRLARADLIECRLFAAHRHRRGHRRDHVADQPARHIDAHLLVRDQAVAQRLLVFVEEVQANLLFARHVVWKPDVGADGHRHGVFARGMFVIVRSVRTFVRVARFRRAYARVCTTRRFAAGST
jgi:hypothetical protein